MGSINFQHLTAALLPSLSELVERWLPGGSFQGREYACGNIQGDPGDSLKVNLDTGKWADFATDDRGGDPISLFAAINGLSQGDAAFQLMELVGQESPAPRTKHPRTTSGQWTIILPVPQDTPRPDFTRLGKGHPQAVWGYKDEQGRLLGFACRFDDPKGGKEIFPLTFGRNDEQRPRWSWKAFPEPRPLYGLDQLASRPDAPALLVEGEKTADAAQRLCPDMVAMTWPGGCKAVAKANWTPLRGRSVVIWPDNDTPGFDAAAAIAIQLEKVGVKDLWRIAPPQDTPKGWDLADAEAEGWDGTKTAAWMRKNSSDARRVAKSHLVVGAESSCTEDDNDGLPAALPPVPLEAFPEPVQGLLTQAALAYNVPLEIPTTCLLAMVSGCVGRSRLIRVNEDFIQPGNLWLALVAESGSGKSHVARAFFDPVFDVDMQRQQEWKRAYAEYEMETRLHRKGKGSNSAPLPLQPTRVQYIMDDWTPESLGEALSQNQRGVLLHRDELAGLIKDLDKYTGKEGSTAARLLTAYDGGPWKTNRRDVLRNNFCRHAAVGIFGTIQPGILGKVFKQEDLDNGFLPRFIMISAVREGPILLSDQSLGQEHKDTLRRLANGLLRLEMPIGPAGEPEPLIYQVDQQAFARFREWHDFTRNEPFCTLDANPSCSAALAAKLVGQGLRLCLLLHCMDGVLAGREPAMTITDECMARALLLAEWVKAHKLNIWPVVRGQKIASPNPAMGRIASALLTLAKQKGFGLVPVAEITSQVNAGQESYLHIKPAVVGKACSTLGLHRERTQDTRFCRILPEDIPRLQAVVRRSG